MTMVKSFYSYKLNVSGNVIWCEHRYRILFQIMYLSNIIFNSHPKFHQRHLPRNEFPRTTLQPFSNKHPTKNSLHHRRKLTCLAKVTLEICFCLRGRHLYWNFLDVPLLLPAAQKLSHGKCTKRFIVFCQTSEFHKASCSKVQKQKTQHVLTSHEWKQSWISQNISQQSDAMV